MSSILKGTEKSEQCCATSVAPSTEEIKYKIRKMTREDVPQVMDLWKETDMHQPINSLYTWLEVDPDFVSVAVTEKGEIIGSCSALIISEDLVYFGLYAVRKNYRGKGIGRKLFAACEEHIGERNLVLDCWPEMMEFFMYRCNMPLLETDYGCIVAETERAVHSEKLSSVPPTGVDVIPLQEGSLPLVCCYDRRVVGLDRRRAIELTAKEPGARAYVALKNGACVGYGIARLSCQGCAQVGPLYADDAATAEAMLKRLILSLPEAKGFTMQTWSCNSQAKELMERIGCQLSEVAPRLYRKRRVEADLNKVFAVFDGNFQLF